jgi:hypothetical protein
MDSKGFFKPRSARAELWEKRGNFVNNFVSPGNQDNNALYKIIRFPWELWE